MNKYKEFANTFLGIAAAAGLGCIAAFFGITFLEGATAAAQIIGVSGDGFSLYSLIFAPMAAGIVCGIVRVVVKTPFCGLADTMLAAQRGDSQPWKPAIASVFASFTSFAAGASVGVYGPIGHLGGFVGGFFRHWQERGVGLACGVAAGIAAAFNAPVTGLLFAHEVILRHYSRRTFAPVAVAAVAGYMVSVGLARPAFLSIGDMPAITVANFAVFGVQGALFGALAAWYLRAIFALGKRLSPFSPLIVLPAAGLICGMLWFFAPNASGGRDLLALIVEDGLPGGWREALFWGAIKTAATIICLGAGFAGGAVTPTLGIGALAGVLYAALTSAIGVYDGPFFVPVVCGMIAFTAPVIGAPLAGILFVLELSGGNYPLTVASSLAVALSISAAGRLGNGSYYEQQLHARGAEIKPLKLN